MKDIEICPECFDIIIPSEYGFNEHGDKICSSCLDNKNENTENCSVCNKQISEWNINQNGEFLCDKCFSEE